MIDLHSHILPGLDDGSLDLSMSISMARQAVEDGIDTVVVTPHFRPPVDYAQQLSAREQAFEALCAALKQEGIALELLPGAECTSNGHLFTQEFPQMPGLLMPTAPGLPKTALVELPLNMSVEHAGDLLFQAQLANYRLILAHPERYPRFTETVDTLKGMLSRGIYLQFNTQALRKGLFHRHITRPVLELMQAAPDQVLLASDAHDDSDRPMKLSPAKETVEDALGATFWQHLTHDNPAKLLGLS